MHVYRLAIEVGLLEARYLDHDARERLRCQQMRALSDEETWRLQHLSRDVALWGEWAEGVHLSGIQRNRQYRAYLILQDKQEALHSVDESWSLHGYTTGLDFCDCPDFSLRNLPCKHIYAAALSSGIAMSLTPAEYETAKEKGMGIVFEFSTDV